MFINMSPTCCFCLSSLDYLETLFLFINLCRPKTSKKDTIPSRSKQKSKATKKSQKPAKGVKTDKRKAAKRRRTSAPSSKGQKVPDRNDSEVQRSSFGDPTLWGQRLPLIVLQKVYQYVVQSSGAIPFLCR